MNGWLDLNETCTYIRYWWDLRVDTRSRSWGQRSRLNIQLCDKIGLHTQHERVIISWWNLYLWLILMRRKSWHKVKVTRSKVKVKHAVLRKNLFLVLIMNEWLDLDETCIYIRYWWDLKVDTRSRGQRSRSMSNIQLCDKIGLPIKHEREIRSWWNLYLWLILIRRKSWPKVKVTRSKVKVKHAVLRKNCTSVTNSDGTYIYYE